VISTVFFFILVVPSVAIFMAHGIDAIRNLSGVMVFIWKALDVLHPSQRRDALEGKRSG
jgi:hypothetical protein